MDTGNVSVFSRYKGLQKTDKLLCSSKMYLETSQIAVMEPFLQKQLMVITLLIIC